MHEAARQRIRESEEVEDTRPVLIGSLEEPSEDYDEFYNNVISGIARLLDDAINIKGITREQRTKLVWLKTRIDLEL